jgi:hypothetical protein
MSIMRTDGSFTRSSRAEGGIAGKEWTWAVLWDELRDANDILAIGEEGNLRDGGIAGAVGVRRAVT